MIYELAQRLRSRGYNVSRNELVFSTLCGITTAIFVIGGIVFGFALVSSFGVEFGEPLVGAAVLGSGGVLLTMLIINELSGEYSNSRCLGLPAAFGFLIGSAVVVGLFALLPSISLLAIPFIILTVFIGELFFLADSREPTQEDNLFAFTVERKIVAFVTAFVGLLAVVGFLQGGRGFLDWTIANWVAVAFFFGIVGFAVVIVLAFYAYIKVNSLKYGRNGGTPPPVQRPAREGQRRVEPDFEYVEDEPKEPRTRDVTLRKWRELGYPRLSPLPSISKPRKKRKQGKADGRAHHIYTPKQIRTAWKMTRKGVHPDRIAEVTGVNRGSLANKTWLEDRFKWASKTKKRK